MRDRAVGRLTAQPPAALVWMLLEEEFGFAQRAIKEAGPRVVPALVAALDDPRFHVKVRPEVNERAHVFEQRSAPLESLLDCLYEYAPAEAAAKVAPLINDVDDDIRKAAARVIGAIGTDACVEPLARCCQDRDDSVRLFAVYGVDRALRLGRMTDGFRAGAYRAMLPLVSQRGSAAGHAARCLLTLDRSAAVKVMTRPANLVAGVEGLHDVLRALREADVQVDHRPLLKLVDSLETRAGEYPNAYVLSEALRLLARTQSPDAEATLQRCAGSPSGQVREAALQGMAERKGIIDPFNYAWAELEARGWDRLEPAQRDVLAVREYLAQVSNGGLSQYFVNSTGSRWRLAEVGLREIGSAVLLSVLRRAVEKFGVEAPSEVDAVRHRQLAAVVRQGGDDVFRELDDVQHKDEEFVESLLWLHILRHPSEFRSHK